MKKSLFEQLGGTYHEENGDLIPNLKFPNKKERPTGIWSQSNLCYLKEHKQIIHLNLLTSGKLNAYLADINEQAEDMFFRLVKNMTKSEGMTEKLKAENQMAWIRAINNIRNRVMETVNDERIYN